MGVFSFSLGLDPKQWSARDIRNTILELAELLSKYQEMILMNESKKMSEEVLIDKFSKMNEVIEGFRYQKRGRKEE